MALGRKLHERIGQRLVIRAARDAYNERRGRIQCQFDLDLLGVTVGSQVAGPWVAGPLGVEYADHIAVTGRNHQGECAISRRSGTCQVNVITGAKAHAADQDSRGVDPRGHDEPSGHG